MVPIIRFFGVLSIIVAVVLVLISLPAYFLIPTFLPLAASALLGGALLLAFARVVELLEEMNEQLRPINQIAMVLKDKYIPKLSAGPMSATNVYSNSPVGDPFSNLPAGSQVERHFKRRVAFLPDDSVIGETKDGPRPFKSFEEWRQFIGE